MKPNLYRILGYNAKPFDLIKFDYSSFSVNSSFKYFAMIPGLDVFCKGTGDANCLRDKLCLEAEFILVMCKNILLISKYCDTHHTLRI